MSDTDTDREIEQFQFQEFEKEDAIPENLRGGYRKHDDGVWRPSIAESKSGFVYMNTQGQQKALHETREERNTLKAERDTLKKQLDDFRKQFGDVDPQVALESHRAIESGEKVDIAKLKQRDETMVSQATKPLQEEIVTLRATVETLEKAATDDISMAKAQAKLATMGGDPEILALWVEKRLGRQRDKNGKLHSVFLDEAGEPLFSRKSSGEYMGVDEFCELMRDHPSLRNQFPQQARGDGGGGRPGPGGGSKTGKWDLSDKDRLFKHLQRERNGIA